MNGNSNKCDSRRKFIKTAGKFAIYTPPALLVMSKANGMAKSNGQCCVNGDKGDIFL